MAFTRFDAVAKNVCREDTSFGRGAIVLAPAILAYRDAWSRYRALAKDVLDTLSPREVTQWEVVAEFIDDDVRTILIARSIRRAIERLFQNGHQEIQVIEAGFGTGFLAALAMSCDERVQLVGYEIQPAKVSVAQRTCEFFGFDSSRCTFQEHAVTERTTLSGQSNILVVAEHISAGLMHELSTDIPRRFEGIDPALCIPHAVHPQLYITDAQGGLVLSGEEIVLADPRASDCVQIRGRINLSAGYKGALKVANGITWSGINVPGLPPVHQRDSRTVSVDGKRNHLLKATCLHASTKRDKNTFWWISNSTTKPVQNVVITVNYPVGFLVNEKAAPTVTIESDSPVRAYTAPIDQILFDRYVAGMRRGE